MTVRAQDLWDAYRESGDGKNHDGTFDLPKNVNDLDRKAQIAWNASAAFVNRHIGEVCKEEREAERKRIRESVCYIIDEGKHYRPATPFRFHPDCHYKATHTYGPCRWRRDLDGVSCVECGAKVAAGLVGTKMPYSGAMVSSRG